MSDQIEWSETKEQSLLNDPRFEAGIMARQSGEYEASIDFFAELLKSFEGDDTQLHLAPLYYNYASSMVCNIETQNEEELKDQKEVEEILVKKRPHEDTVEKENKITKTNDESEERSTVQQEEEDEEEDEEDEGDEDDDEVAWQCLDMARDLYQQALASQTIHYELKGRLKQEMARTISRIGDLNMIQSKFADALIEYELCLKIRGENKETSIENICRLSDSNMQVAFAYLEHLRSKGCVDVVAESSDGSSIVVARGDECTHQAFAFRDQAKILIESLISRLARERASCSPEEKELICVQYQLLSDFGDRMSR